LITVARRLGVLALTNPCPHTALVAVAELSPTHPSIASMYTPTSENIRAPSKGTVHTLLPSTRALSLASEPHVVCAEWKRKALSR
jgi:hypothetical protein